MTEAVALVTTRLPLTSAVVCKFAMLLTEAGAARVRAYVPTLTLLDVDAVVLAGTSVKFTEPPLPST